GERGVAGAAVLLARAALDQAEPLEGVHEVGDSAAGHEDLALHLAQQERPLVVQRLEDGELAGCEAVARDVRLAVREHGRVRAREHGPQLQRKRLALAPFGRATGARPGVWLAHDPRISVRPGTRQAAPARRRARPAPWRCVGAV